MYKWWLKLKAMQLDALMITWYRVAHLQTLSEAQGSLHPRALWVNAHTAHVITTSLPAKQCGPAGVTAESTIGHRSWVQATLHLYTASPQRASQAAPSAMCAAADDQMTIASCLPVGEPSAHVI